MKDATRDLIVTVTESDIKSAKRRDNTHCAAANALCRQEHFRQAMVYKTKTYVERRDGYWLRFITPGNLYTELMIFDRGGRMEAGDFILRAPKGIEKLGAHVKPKGKLGQTGRQPKVMHFIDNVRANAPKGPGLFRALADA